MTQVKTILASLSIAVTAAVVGPMSANASAGSTNTNACIDGTNPANYTTSFTRGSGTITVKNGSPLCQNTKITLESFTLPDSWNGQGFNESALPQTKFAATSFTIPAGQANYKTTVSINVPADCKSTQLDFYKGDGFNKLVGLHDDDAAYIGGKIFKGSGACVTPTPSPTVTPKPTATPVPTKTPVPVASPTPTPAVLGTSTLPDTGMEGLMGAFGLTAMATTAGLYIKQRLNNK